MCTFTKIKSELSNKFEEAIHKNSFGEFLKNTRSTLSKLRSSNSIKIVMELTLREVLLRLIKQKADVKLLERVFQYSIDAALCDSAAGNIPVLILGDLLEASSIVDCEQYFSFAESRVHIFKQDTFFKSCKNNLLRCCNDLLKRLSRSQNTVFCGRILMFLASICPLSERSGLNIISEFNVDNSTSYSTNDDAFNDINLEKGDGTEEGEISAPSTSHSVVDKNLYQKFWSLQDFFRSPNICYNKMQWRSFAASTLDVLTVFGSFKSDDASSSKWRQTKLPSPDGSSVYFAKYLTSPKLLELELSDSHFRRYVLVQFLILFQYLTTPVKFKLESYILTEDQQNWLKENTKKIYKLLAETPPNGEIFAQDVEKILQREEYWNTWKNEGCPDFKNPDEASLEQRLKRPSDDLHTYPNKKTKTDTNKLWNTIPNNWEACRSAKRNFVPTLESYFGKTTRHAKRDSKFAWKALRLLCMKSPLVFSASSAPAKSVPDYLDAVVQKIAKEKPSVQQDLVTMADDETMDEDFFPPPEEEPPKEEAVPQPPKKVVVSRQQIEDLASSLDGQSIRALGPHLGFLEDEVEYFETQGAQVMLQVWVERDGRPDALQRAMKAASISS